MFSCIDQAIVFIGHIKRSSFWLFRASRSIMRWFQYECFWCIIIGSVHFALQIIPRKRNQSSKKRNFRFNKILSPFDIRLHSVVGRIKFNKSLDLFRSFRDRYNNILLAIAVRFFIMFEKYCPTIISAQRQCYLVILFLIKCLVDVWVLR